MRITVVIFTLLFVTTIATARTWYITSDGTGDASTIQAGIDSSASGDTVLVACGTYYDCSHPSPSGRLACIVMKSGICLISESGEPDCVTVDAESQGRVIFCDSVGNTSSIEGMTFTGGLVNGVGDYGGGGIICFASYLSIINCVFQGNAAEYSGGGLYGRFSSPTISGCKFYGNSAGMNGGAMAWHSSAAFIEQTTIRENTAGIRGGGFCCYYSPITLTECNFYENSSDDGGALWNAYAAPTLSFCQLIRNTADDWGGGIFWSNCSASILNCTLFENSASNVGGGMYDYNASPSLERTIIAFSLAGGAVYSNEGSPTLICSDVYGNSGGDWTGCIADQLGINGNISNDPLFCDADLDDLTLHSNSPCSPGNHPDGISCGLIGALAVECGPATAVEQMSWGGIKSLFQ